MLGFKELINIRIRMCRDLELIQSKRVMLMISINLLKLWPNIFQQSNLSLDQMRAPASHFALSVSKEDARIVNNALVRKTIQVAKDAMKKCTKKMNI